MFGSALSHDTDIWKPVKMMTIIQCKHAKDNRWQLSLLALPHNNKITE